MTYTKLKEKYLKNRKKVMLKQIKKEIRLNTYYLTLDGSVLVSYHLKPTVKRFIRMYYYKLGFKINLINYKTVRFSIEYRWNK